MSAGALAQLNAEYARALDDDRLEDWPEFFAEPCLYTITSVDNYTRGLPVGLMYPYSKWMLRDLETPLRQDNINDRQA